MNLKYTFPLKKVRDNTIKCVGIYYRTIFVLQKQSFLLSGMTNVTRFCDFASVTRTNHFRSRGGANSIHGTDYLFKTRVGGREFSVHFIELKIIGYQASINTCESRRFLHENFFVTVPV